MKRGLRKWMAVFDSSKLRITQNKLLIDGKWVESVEGETFASINPFTEKEICRVQKASASDVDVAVKAARKAFDEGSWPRMASNDRSRILFKLADLMEQNKEELAAIESLDNGKPYLYALFGDLPFAINTLRYYAGWADKIQGQTLPMIGPYFSFTREEPVGVCGLIYPWNFPIALAICKLSPCLATGCVAILKPAEQTPLSILRIGELALEAGVPPGVINILTGYGDVGQALVGHPGVDKISFTGSTEVGREILSRNGHPNIKRMTMELGGKSAIVVLDDVDVDLVVPQAHTGLFFNQGQVCAAGSRTFVHSKIYDKFVDKMVQHTNSQKLGDPFDPQTHQGPQIDKIQQDKIYGYIEQGKKAGATMLTGHATYNSRGYFVNQTVFADVQDHMTIAKEEIFGPVMSILRFDSVDEAIRRANQSHYGLSAGIFGRNMSDVNKLVKGLKAGSVWVNGYSLFQQTTPFGGYKDSGLGRELGEAGLRAYLETKTVVYHQ